MPKSDSWYRNYPFKGVTVGKVGMRIEIDLEVGYCGWHRGVYSVFYDEAGNRFTWKPSKRLLYRPGTRIRIRGRIKAHYTPLYVNHQTELCYCRVIKEY